jgi:hypothetical protein
VWRGSVVDILRVFVPDGVADVVAFVLDPPLVSDIVVQVHSRGVPGGEAGDDESVFLSGFLAVKVVGSPSDAGGLLRIWEINAISVGDPCLPCVDATSGSFPNSVIGRVLDQWNCLFMTASRSVG